MASTFTCGNSRRIFSVRAMPLMSGRLISTMATSISGHCLKASMASNALYAVAVSFAKDNQG
jgi:hypothetical protein